MATFWNNYQQNSGSLGNKSSENIAYNYASRIYIGSARSKRIIELPAFIRDLKYNISKEMETITEKDKMGDRYIEKTSTVSMNLNIDVPAASAEEAKYNLIRVSEIMRMISVTGLAASSESTADSTAKIYMLFSNLISRGNLNPPSSLKKFAKLKKHGLPGYIKDFDYTPDVDAGFFVDDDYRSPRNIKVAITFSVETIDWSLYEDYKNWSNVEFSAFVMRGLSQTGEYTSGDSGGFPYGVSVRDPRAAGLGTLKAGEYTFESLNKYDSDYAADVGSYFVMGNWWKGKKGKRSDLKTAAGLVEGIHLSATWHCPVFCRFKMFLEDYKFSKKTGLEPLHTVNSDVGVTYKNYSDNDSEFDIKFSTVADSLEQAKKDCGKVQILMRLFFTENEYNTIKKNFDPYTEIYRNVYIPNLLENKDSSGECGSWKKEYNNSIGCRIKTITVDHIHDLGYFVEVTDGVKKYYPKGFKISIAGAVVGSNNQYSGRPGNYDSSTGLLIRNDIKGMIQFPFKFK